MTTNRKDETVKSAPHFIELPAADWDLICDMFGRAIEMSLAEHRSDNTTTYQFVESVFHNLQKCDEKVNWAEGFGYHQYF